MSFFPQNRSKSISSEIHAQLTTGVVVENYDEEHPGMVKVNLPIRTEGLGTTDWIQVVAPYSGEGRGLYLHPEVGDTVVVGFIGGDDRNPIVLGTIWEAGVEFPEEAVDADNKFKVFRSKQGTKITITDEEGKEKIETLTPGGLSVTMADEEQSITVKDSDGTNQVIINAKDGKVSVDAGQTILLTCGSSSIELAQDGTITIKGATVNVEADQTAKVKGMTVNVEGTTTNVKASGNLTLEASGVGNLKGTTVKING